MAKYTLGSGVDQFKGSRGGSVFQRMGTSFAIRTRRKPIFKRSPRSSRSRSAFTGRQQHYRTISAFQRSEWESAVVDWERVNSLGETYTMSGINLQNFQNAGYFTFNDALRDVPFGNQSFLSLDVVSVIYDVQPSDFSIVTNPASPGSTRAFELFVAPFQYSEVGSPGQLTFRSAFYVEPNSSWPINLAPAVEAINGPPVDTDLTLLYFRLRIYRQVGQFYDQPIEVVQLDV